MKTLKDVACGQTVQVKRLTGEGPVKRRIMDMGITKGIPVSVRKVAPLGDPVEMNCLCGKKMQKRLKWNNFFKYELVKTNKR